jgi:hypothetical protein
MYSLGVCGDTECSSASAGRWKSRRQSGPWIRCSSGRIRSGRFGGEDEADEDEERAEEDELETER